MLRFAPSPTLIAMILCTGLVLGLASPAAAEVLERRENGFVLRFSAPVRAAPDAIFRTLGAPSLWWEGAHTHGGDAAALSLSPQPGGCFCEALADGPFEHGRVVHADPARMLALRAPLGPLKATASRADLVFHWRQAEGGWALSLTYVVEGPGLGAMADAVDGVLATQFTRLVGVLETPTP